MGFFFAGKNKTLTMKVAFKVANDLRVKLGNSVSQKIIVILGVAFVNKHEEVSII